MPVPLAELKQRIVGIFPAIPTPLTEDEQLDAPALERMVDYLLSGGVHGLWVLGSGGEAATLSGGVRREMIENVVSLVDGRVPVLIGTGAPGTEQTIANTRQAAQLGADAAAVVAPYYFLLSPGELKAHYEAVLRECELPVMIYHNPHNTKLPMSLELVEELSANEQVIGIKDSTADFSFTQALLQRFGNRPNFRIIQGYETTVAVTILLGGHGAVLGMANLAPRLCVDLFDAASEGDIVRAFGLQGRVNKLLESLWSGIEAGDGLFIGGIKTGMSLLGLCEPHATRPFRDLTKTQTKKLRTAMEREGLFD